MPNITWEQWQERAAEGRPQPDRTLTPVALPCGAILQFRRGMAHRLDVGRAQIPVAQFDDYTAASALGVTAIDWRIPITEARAYLAQQQGPATVAAPPSETAPVPGGSGGRK